jgi:hypothetical protein
MFYYSTVITTVFQVCSSIIFLILSIFSKYFRYFYLTERPDLHRAVFLAGIVDGCCTKRKEVV